MQKKNTKLFEHCCKKMKQFLDEKKVAIEYSPIGREYYIDLKGSAAKQCFFYCPWCGKRLPTSLRNEYFDTLKKEHGIDDRYDKEQAKRMPKAFKSDAWWNYEGSKFLSSTYGLWSEEKMRPRDILHEVHSGLITDNEAKNIYNEVFNQCAINPHMPNILEYFKLSVPERNALYFYSMPYTVVAQWRYEGWPITCAICEKDVVTEKDGWRAVREVSVQGGKVKNNVLVHDYCYLEMQRAQNDPYE